MFDALLRPIKARAYAPLARHLHHVAPDHVTAAGGVIGVLGATAAALGRFDVALAAWLLNRALDGLDGEIARNRLDRAPSPSGAYLDLMVDLLVYTLLPLGVAVGVGDGTIWLATAALLGAFYLNLGSWVLLALSLPAAPAGEHAPGLRMPSGLVEGGETIVAFTLLLALPQHAVTIVAAFALLTLIGATDRTVRGLERLRAAPPGR